MSLRATDCKVFEIVCDTCGVKTAMSLMPVEAEVRAAEGGWRAEKNPLRHKCPWCVAKTTPGPSVSPIAPNVSSEQRNVSPTAGR